MKERILKILQELRGYALAKGCDVALFYQEEDSYLMRFANSAISLNTNEHLIRLEITAYAGQKRASYEMITNLDQVDEMKKGIDTAAEMAQHAQPLSYQPTNPHFKQTFADESCYDPALAHLSNEDRLDYFNRATAGLETDEIKLSGVFTCGENTIAQITTRSEHTQYFKTSDAQITAVLAHSRLKWEVQAEQSAQKKQDLDAAGVHSELAFLLKHYQNDPALQMPLGNYTIVFGASAVADMISIMNWIGFSGGSLKRGFSFLTEANVGQKVFSPKFTLVDDPGRRETFPSQFDLAGIARKPFPIFEEGVFKAFTWYQDDADEFGAAPTGHNLMHKSLVLGAGGQKLTSLEDLVNMPREEDILYIPFLHYMNIVNPSKGVFTASSRFGALLLKKDGSVMVPYNVRVTQSLQDIFGDKLEWLSSKTVAYNTSSSYGARNPTAVIVPNFVCVKDLEISHSNSSY